MKRWLLLLALATTPAAAQERPATRVWLAGGIVPLAASREVEAGLGLLAQLVGMHGPHYGSVRVAGALDFAGFPDSGGGNSMAEVGLTYGRGRITPATELAAATGLALVHFSECPDGERELCYALGIPIVLETALKTDVFGIGIQAFGNLNAKAPYAGLAVFLQLGWLE